MSRRQDLARRVSSAQVAHAGWATADYRVALAAAAQAWMGRFPWRLLPLPLRTRAFPVLGRRFAARFLVCWRAAESE